MGLFKKKSPPSFEEKQIEARLEYERTRPDLVAMETMIRRQIVDRKVQCQEEILTEIRKTGEYPGHFRCTLFVPNVEQQKDQRIIMDRITNDLKHEIFVNTAYELVGHGRESQNTGWDVRVRF